MNSAPVVPAAVEVSPVDNLPVSPLAWALLVAFVLAILLVDLLVVHREAKVIAFRDAAVSSAVYMAIGLGFGLVVWGYMGGAASAVYYGGFVLEKSLSIDNVFVWAVIFSYFGTPPQYQHRVLFWGSSAPWSCGRRSSSPASRCWRTSTGWSSSSARSSSSPGCSWPATAASTRSTSSAAA